MNMGLVDKALDVAGLSSEILGKGILDISLQGVGDWVGHHEDALRIDNLLVDSPFYHVLGYFCVKCIVGNTVLWFMYSLKKFIKLPPEDVGKR